MSDMSSDLMLYHGGARGMRPGDVIEPHPPNYVDGCEICDAHRQGAEIAIGGQVIDPANHAPEFVFATTDREYGKFYASKFPRGDLYRVEPIGELIPSEHDPFPTWMARSFRVLAVYERRVELTNSQRRRLLKRWPDEMWAIDRYEGR